MPVTRLQRLQAARLQVLTLTKDFLRWWVDELREWIDALSIPGRPGQIRTFRLVFGDQAVGYRVDGARRSETFREGALEGVDVAPVVQRLLAEQQSTSVQLDVELPASWILDRRVRVPSAARARLREAIALQLPRLSPLVLDRIDYAFAPLEDDGDKMQVRFVLAKRAALDTLIESLSRFRLKRLRVFSPAGATGVPLLLRDVRNRERRPTEEKWAWRLVATAAVLLALLPMSLIGRLAYENGRLDKAVNHLREQSQEAAKLSLALDTRDEQMQRLIGILQHPESTALLEDATRRMPSDAWVYQFQLEGGSKLMLAGIAPDASAVVAALSRSGIFTKVTLGHATKVGEGKERFDVTMQVKERPP
jgi:Tfp pilus assembly protein PilN